MAKKEGLIGRKLGMTQIFGDDGNHVPVTVIEAGPCTVVGIRTKDSHGYDALQLGFGPKRKNVSKPEAGLFKKANVAPLRVLREVRLEKTEKLQGYSVGQALTVDVRAAAGAIVEHAYVDYRWTADGDVLLRHPINPRLGLFVHFTGEMYGVDGTVPDRGTQTGARIEAGVQVNGRAGTLEFFAGGERRLDADPIDRQTHSWGLAGFRLLSR